MKNKKIRVVVIVMSLILVLTGVAYASIGSRTAELFYNNIKIWLDGKEIVPVDASGNVVEPFIIDGTTYLPVRAVSSALGLDVSWNDQTKTVELNTPGVFAGGVQVYEDENVVIDFAGCTMEKPYDWMDTVYYYANFNVRNKTDVELTFQPDSLSFNGISYNSFSGSESVAPQSTGKISFYTETNVPISGISKTSGQIAVIDFNADLSNMSYDAKWVNVTQ